MRQRPRRMPGRWPTRVAGLWAGLARSTPWRMCGGHQAVYDGWATAGAPGWRVAACCPFSGAVSGPGPPGRHHCRGATAAADRSARDWPCEVASAAAELRHPAVATPASEVHLVRQCCIGRSVRMAEHAGAGDRLLRWPSRAGRMLRGSGGGRGRRWRVHSGRGGGSARTRARRRRSVRIGGV